MKARQFPFVLPLGYRDIEGRIHREVCLRKMTGHEELLMSDSGLAKNGGKLVTELLASCLVKLGTLAQVTREHVAVMTSADRDFLLVRLRAITFGSKLEAAYSCTFCGSPVHYVHDLDALPVKNVEGGGDCEIVVDLEDGYEDRGESFIHMTFRPPNGEDEELTADLARQNISRAKNSILTRCLKRFGNMPAERFQALGTQIFLDLTMADRRKIDKAFEEQMPGIALSLELICPSCKQDFSVRLDLGNFLLPA